MDRGDEHVERVTDERLQNGCIQLRETETERNVMNKKEIQNEREMERELSGRT